MRSTQQTAPMTFALFLQKVQQLDLSPIAYQLMHAPAGPRWTKAQTIKAIAQYLTFLYLTDCYPHLQLVPSLDIDRVWHYHILDTSKYAEDCQMLFGYIIHHFPYLGQRGGRDRYNQHQAYALTCALLNKYLSSSSIEAGESPADCEPIRFSSINPIDYLDVVDDIDARSPVADCRHHLSDRSRPRVTLDIDEILTSIAALCS